MNKELNDGRLTQKACFFSRYGRNHAGYRCHVRIVPCGEELLIPDRPRHVSPEVQGASKPHCYRAADVGYIMTDMFNAILFGSQEQIQAEGEAWYKTCPPFEEIRALRLLDNFLLLPLRERPDFFNWLVESRQLLVLAHLLSMPHEAFARFKARGDLYHTARHKAWSDYQRLLEAGERNTAKAAEDLRKVIPLLTAAEQKVAAQRLLLERAPAEMERMRARSKYAVPDLRAEAAQELVTLEKGVARLQATVTYHQNMLAAAQLRLEDLREFLPLAEERKTPRVVNG